MAKDYVEQRDGGYYVLGTRVSLDSVVYAFLRGESADGIAESFPSLNLQQVYGALDFYCANQILVGEYLREQQRQVEQMRLEARRRNSELHAKVAQARKNLRD